ncbi:MULTISPECIES: TRAP transporter small permease [Vibrio]|uniref:TRAP transporter small permease n=2 Tax=Vibrio TaxID=662 RepID=UPI000380D20D|nr:MULTISPECIES: TRAP transporter small permease subunit [Vibrio]MCG9559361.1 TRAP transporter small permease subunit [Vibrio kanaloae]MCY9862205.1 TRAP transporter small permease subunit [Vibrio coralliirubri]KPM01454.1 C4-dicarboxylate ABC transporter permease [Vibrio splendidus]MBY7731411.1 TRAP transporter small permease subunit [Vibrio splendidus]NOH75586.1 TRAP transporter small permease subunit [Vibrio crassostreae]
MEQKFRYLLTALIASVALMQFVQVVTRYIFEVPIMGLEESMVIPTIWLYMLGAVNASREDSQIRANVLEIFIKSERGHTILALVGEIISFIISSWLTYWAWDYVKYAWRVWKESPTLYIPTFYHECSVFIGLLLITLFIAIHIVKLVNQLRTPSSFVNKVKQ